MGRTGNITVNWAHKDNPRFDVTQWTTSVSGFKINTRASQLCSRVAGSQRWVSVKFQLRSRISAGNDFTESAKRVGRLNPAECES